MRTLRSMLLWLHLVVGVLCSSVILSLALSGVLLVYQGPIQDWLDTRHERRVRDPRERPLGIGELVERVQAAEGARPTALTFSADPAVPVAARLGRERVLFLDGFTGQVLGEGSPRARAFFRSITAWHRWLGGQGSWRAAGRALTGASTLGLVFLLLSGFILWCPRSWTPRVLRELLWFRGGPSPRGRDLSQHRVLGFWALGPLLVIALSGVVIAYPWANSLLFALFGEQASTRRGPEPRVTSVGPASPVGTGAFAAPGSDARPDDLRRLDGLLAQARRALPGWRTITLQLPASSGAPVVFTLASGTAGQPQARATLTLSPTGEVLEWAPFASQSPGRRWRALLRYAHTGEVAGLAGQTLAGLAALCAAWLAWTGLALTWRRLQCWRQRLRGDCSED